MKLFKLIPNFSLNQWALSLLVLATTFRLAGHLDPIKQSQGKDIFSKIAVKSVQLKNQSAQLIQAIDYLNTWQIQIKTLSEPSNNIFFSRDAESELKKIKTSEELLTVSQNLLANKLKNYDLAEFFKLQTAVLQFTKLTVQAYQQNESKNAARFLVAQEEQIEKLIRGIDRLRKKLYQPLVDNLNSLQDLPMNLNNQLKENDTYRQTRDLFLDLLIFILSFYLAAKEAMRLKIAASSSKSESDPNSPSNSGNDSLSNVA